MNLLYIFAVSYLNEPIKSACQQTIEHEKWNGFLNFVEHRSSFNNTYQVHVTFTNEARDQVSLYKVRSMHKQLSPLGLKAASILPGENVKISCEIGDTFTARVDSPGSQRDQMLLMAHDVSRIYINDKMCNDTPLHSCNRAPFSAEYRWTPPDSFMFTNSNDDSVDLFYFDGSCEEHVGTIESNRDHHIQSTIGHTFRIRETESKRLIQEYTLSEVPIKDLESDDDFEFSEKASVLFDKLHIKLLEESMKAHENLITELKERYNVKNVCA